MSDKTIRDCGRDCGPQDEDCKAQCSPQGRPDQILRERAKRLRYKATAMEQLADQLEYHRFGPEATSMLCSIILSARE